MALSREEISQIGKEAADKVAISKQCLEKAYHVYEAHEYAHAASGSALKLDQESADRYLNLMRSELEAADLPIENLEELGQDIVDAAHWIKEKNKEAVHPLGRFLDKTKELMFQVIVDCECGGEIGHEGSPGVYKVGDIEVTIQYERPGVHLVTISPPGNRKVTEKEAREIDKLIEKVTGIKGKPTFKPTRDMVELHTWCERDRLSIEIRNKVDDTTIAIWWDDDARQMFEDGFFKGGVPTLSWEKPSSELIESVMSYAEDMGILAK